MICLDTGWAAIELESEQTPQSGVAADNAAYMIYTSGSTGKPKGVINTHRGVVNWLLWMQDEYKLTADDAVMQKTTFAFDVSLWEFFLPLSVGARLVIARPQGHQDSRYLIDLIAREQITLINFVPSMLRIFLQDPEVARCTSLKWVICTGEPLLPDLQDAFFTRLPNMTLHNLYGPTEAAVEVTIWDCMTEPRRASCAHWTAHLPTSRSIFLMAPFSRSRWECRENCTSAGLGLPAAIATARN